VIHGLRKLTDGGNGNGGPGEIRTPDLTVRSRSLYPTELRAPRDEFYYLARQKRKLPELPAIPSGLRTSFRARPYFCSA
jgi:hypothetical protein